MASEQPAGVEDPAQAHDAATFNQSEERPVSARASQQRLPWQLRWQRTFNALGGVVSRAHGGITEQFRALFARRMAAATPVLLFLGDSLTRRGLDINEYAGYTSVGWGLRLVHAYNGAADCIFRGLSGYNTRWALPVVRHHLSDVAQERLLLVGIWFGANDAAAPGTAQYVPLDEYASNLYEMLRLILERSHDASLTLTSERHPQRQQHGRTPPSLAAAAAPDASEANEIESVRYPRVLLMTPPWVDEEARRRHIQSSLAAERAAPDAHQPSDSGQRTESDRMCARTRQYAAACRRVAAQIRPRDRVLLLDLFTQIEQLPPAERSGLFIDGLHLSDRGQRFVYDAILELIAREAPELSPSSLGQFAIPWCDINPVRPQEQLAVYDQQRWW